MKELVGPNADCSLLISSDFSERLKDSLCYLLDFWEDTIEVPLAKNIRSNIDRLRNGHEYFWYYSAINKRIVELTESKDLGKVSGKVKKYFSTLDLPHYLKEDGFCFLSYSDLPKVQSSLFVHYGSQNAPEDKLFFPISQEDFNTTVKVIKESLSVTKTYLKDFYSETVNYINSFIIFTSHTTSSGTSFDLAKSMYVQSSPDYSEIKVLRMLDRIVHETAHMHLHLMSANDPFVKNSPQELYKSPFRKDGRPMIGIYHAHFVLYRLISALSLLRSEPKIKHLHDEIEDMLKRYHSAFKETSAILEVHGDFTELGNHIFQESCQSVSRL